MKTFWTENPKAAKIRADVVSKMGWKPDWIFNRPVRAKGEAAVARQLVWFRAPISDFRVLNMFKDLPAPAISIRARGYIRITIFKDGWIKD